MSWGGLSSPRRGRCSPLHPVQWSPCCGSQGQGRAGHGCDAVATWPLLPRTTTTSCTRGSTTHGTSWSCRRGSSSGECRALTAPGWGQGWGWAEAGAAAAQEKRRGRGTGAAFATDRAAKQRRKGDRIVIDCQEQAYWLVNRPPVRPRALAPCTALGAGAGGWWCWGGSLQPWHVAVVAAGSPQRAGAGPRAQELPHQPRAAGRCGLELPRGCPGCPSPDCAHVFFFWGGVNPSSANICVSSCPHCPC